MYLYKDFIISLFITPLCIHTLGIRRYEFIAKKNGFDFEHSFYSSSNQIS